MEHDYRHSSQLIPQYLAVLDTGKSRQFPLSACCYQIVICYIVWHPLTLYKWPRLQESNSKITCNISTSITTQVHT
jgi:hypothetical protein